MYKLYISTTLGSYGFTTTTLLQAENIRFYGNYIYSLQTTENIGFSGILSLYTLSKPEHTCFNTRFDTKCSNHLLLLQKISDFVVFSKRYKLFIQIHI